MNTRVLSRTHTSKLSIKTSNKQATSKQQAKNNKQEQE